MNAAVHKQKKGNTLITTIAASAIVVATSFLNFLRFNNYPIISAETALVSVGLLLLIILLGFIHHHATIIGKAILEGLLVTIILNQNTVPIVWSFAAGLALAALILFRRSSMLPVLGMLSLFTLISGFLGIGTAAGDNDQLQTRKTLQPQAAGKTEKASAPPALLHLILDEHIGLEGLSDKKPNSLALKSELKARYLKQGFRVYGRAYSQHFHTINAIPQIMNFGAEPPRNTQSKKAAPLEQNAYFDRLLKNGYSLHIWQTNFMDFCQGRPVASCTRLHNGQLGAIHDLPSLSTLDKAHLIAVRFARLFQPAKIAGKYYDTFRLNTVWGSSLPNLNLGTVPSMSTVNGLMSFDNLVKNLEKAQPGHAYFAHIVMPHFPYVTTEDCKVKKIHDWQERQSHRPLNDRQNAYFEQIRCVSNKLENAVAALHQSPSANNFVVVVHGDHGSRIAKIQPTYQNQKRFSDQDFIAGFSTLMAVRSSAIPAEYEDQPVTVSQILDLLSAKNFKQSPDSANFKAPPVQLDDENWVPQAARSLPAKWLNKEQ